MQESNTNSKYDPNYIGSLSAEDVFLLVGIDEQSVAKFQDAAVTSGDSSQEVDSEDQIPGIENPATDKPQK